MKTIGTSCDRNENVKGKKLRLQTLWGFLVFNQKKKKKKDFPCTGVNTIKCFWQKIFLGKSTSLKIFSDENYFTS
jgi:hypothetical protein